MTIYIYLTLGILILGSILRNTFNRKKADRIVMVLSFIAMVLIAGLRGMSVGVDTIHYKWIFEDSVHLRLNQIFSFYVEFGYVLWNKLVYFLFRDYQFLLVANALIIYIGIIYYIGKTSEDVVFSLFLFVTIGYFTSSMNTMRQFLALTLILVSYYFFIHKERKTQSYILILLACTIHSSAFIILAVYWGYNILTGPAFKRSLLVKMAMFFGGAILVLSLDMIMNYLIQIGVVLSMEKLTTSAGITTSVFSFSMFVKVFISVLYFNLKKNKRIEESKRERLSFLNYLNIVSCFVNVGAGIFPLLSRLNVYFALPSIVFIPNVLGLSKKSNRIIIKIAAYILFFASFMLAIKDNSEVQWVYFNK